MKLILRLLIVFAALYGLYFVHLSIGWRICYSQLTYVSDQDYYRYLFEYIYDNNHRELVIKDRSGLRSDKFPDMPVIEITDSNRSVFVSRRLIVTGPSDGSKNYISTGVDKTDAFWTGSMELIANTIRGAEMRKMGLYDNGRWEGGATYVFEPCGNLATILN